RGGRLHGRRTAAHEALPGIGEPRVRARIRTRGRALTLRSARCHIGWGTSPLAITSASRAERHVVRQTLPGPSQTHPSHPDAGTAVGAIASISISYERSRAALS